MDMLRRLINCRIIIIIIIIIILTTFVVNIKNVKNSYKRDKIFKNFFL